MAITGTTPQTKTYGNVYPNCFASDVHEGQKNAHTVPVASQEYTPYPNRGGVANITAFRKHAPTSIQYNRKCNILSAK